MLLGGIPNPPEQEKGQLASCTMTSSYFYDYEFEGPNKRQTDKEQKHEARKEEFTRFHTVLFSSGLIQKIK